jgi:hypothetical protein
MQAKKNIFGSFFLKNTGFFVLSCINGIQSVAKIGQGYIRPLDTIIDNSIS